MTPYQAARRRTCLAAGLTGLGLQGTAFAQEDAFPTRPLRIITWSAAGGTIDIFTRMVAENLQRSLGQPVTVENRVGASGIVATEYVAHTKADGYTLLVTATTAQVHNALLKLKLPYDPIKDFEPLSLLARGRHALITRADAPYSTVPEFIELARKKPGGLSYGSWGQGSAGHLMGALLAQQTGVTLVHAGYKGGDVATVTDVIGGVLDAAFVAQGSAKIHSRSGRIKVLAVAGEGRAASLPNVPSFGEAGYKGFDVYGWIAALAPAGTPPATVQKISSALRAIMQLPPVVTKSEELDFEAVGSTPAALMDTQRADFVKWGGMVKASGLQAE